MVLIKGPESIGMDVTFVDYGHVYGIPEHASSFALKSTSGEDGAYSEPYRLYNLDVFEYELDSPSSLYGAIPFMYAHKKTSKGSSSDAAILWLNAAETWIDVTKTHSRNPLSFTSKQPSTQTHWISESGILDVLIFLAPDSHTIFQQYGELTGTTPPPPLFSIGHHQCRWNYLSEDDVLSVNAGFDDYDIPYDTIWLDIEYTDDKQYFTWDERNFPHPEKMLETLDEGKRKMVVIIDPHIKRKDGYWVFKEGEKKELMVRNPEGGVYDGWCWPGSSSWVDFTAARAREWWFTLFKFNKFKVTSPRPPTFATYLQFFLALGVVLMYSPPRISIYGTI
jgi:mannosyl-oligosaccharide alpha-1,3-glucosidase